MCCGFRMGNFRTTLDSTFCRVSALARMHISLARRQAIGPLCVRWQSIQLKLFNRRKISKSCSLSPQGVQGSTRQGAKILRVVVIRCAGRLLQRIKLRALLNTWLLRVARGCPGLARR